MTTLRPLNLELQHIIQLQLFQQHATKEMFDNAFGRNADHLWAAFEANGRNLLALDWEQGTKFPGLDLVCYLNGS